MSSVESVDLTESIAPRSDQQNFDDYLSGPRTVTVDKVTRGSAEQPISIHLLEYPGRPYKPSKSMRRVLVYCWGADASVYAGRRLRLYGDPTVQFGGQTVGGIKISHLSHIESAQNISLTKTRGRRENHHVEPLPDAPPPQSAPPKQLTAESIITAFAKINVTVAQLETRVGTTHDKWTAEQIAELAALGKSIKAGETTPYEEFEQEPVQGELGEGGSE